MAIVPSFWENDFFQQPADVVIVGGGHLGLWTAYALRQQQPHLRIILLEAEAIPYGASTRNAGFACFGSPTELLHDAALLGEANMLRIVEQRYRGIVKIRSVMAGTDIGYEACGGYECLTTVPDGFNDQLQYLNQILKPIAGSGQVYSLATDDMDAMGLTGFGMLVRNNDEGCLHSGRLVEALTQLVRQSGVHVYHGMPVEHWQPTSGGVEVLAGGRRWQARSLVFATNAWLSQQFPQLGIVPARGQVIVTHPIPGLPLHGTFHFDEGFYYFRHLPGGRLLLGGARNADVAGEETLKHELTTPVQQRLEQFLIQHMPQYFTASNMGAAISQRWSGFMAMSPDKQPVLQQVAPQVWAAMCCNGMGVALAPVFSEEVAEAVFTNL